uniref:Uncharacterized protein n=1 Tax=Ditylenchus dipsaci TaxID=166011 RepID=A0A915ES05_9BILA
MSTTCLIQLAGGALCGSVIFTVNGAAIHIRAIHPQIHARVFYEIQANEENFPPEQSDTERYFETVRRINFLS